MCVLAEREFVEWSEEWRSYLLCYKSPQHNTTHYPVNTVSDFVCVCVCVCVSACVRVCWAAGVGAAEIKDCQNDCVDIALSQHVTWPQSPEPGLVQSEYWVSAPTSSLKIHLG